MMRLVLSLVALSMCFTACGDECEFDTECALGSVCMEGSCTSLPDVGIDTNPLPDTGPADTGSDVQIDTPIDVPSDVSSDAPITCDYNGISLLAVSASFQDMAHTYSGQSDQGEYLVIQTSPGSMVASYDLSLEPFLGCQRCVSVRRGCTSVDSCEKVFVPVSGSLTLTMLGMSGERFQGMVSGVFREFDGTNLVEGGEVWCLEGASFDAQVSVPLK